MDIFWIYIFKSLILPPTIFLLSGMVGLLLFPRRIAFILLTLSGGGLLVMSLPWTANQLAKHWESISSPDKITLQAFKPEAVVVLGGGIKKSKVFGENYTLESRTWARVFYAVKIAREFAIPILVSGGRVMAASPVSEAEIMTDVIQTGYGINVRWRDERSRNTAENALYSHEILSRQGIKRIILVTQAYHMPRALPQFVSTGFDVLAFPVDFMSDAYRTDIFSFIPSVFALERNFLICHEALGMLWYKLRY